MQNLWLHILDAQDGGAGGPIGHLFELFTAPDASVSAILHGLWRILLANMTLANSLAVLGATFFLVTLLARTIVPLRVASIISSVFFVAYGVLAASFATFLLYILLLPINIVRLFQMLKLVKRARNSASGNLSFDWLKPFMTPRKYRKGDFLCRKGEKANEMFYTVAGKFLVTEIGVELPEGRILGELGFLSPDNARTHTVQCLEDGVVLVISYDKLLELYFQNPEFGYYFLRLTSERLLQNVARLESTVARLESAGAQYEARPASLTAQPAQQAQQPEALHAALDPPDRRSSGALVPAESDGPVAAGDRQEAGSARPGARGTTMARSLRSSKLLFMLTKLFHH
jgi:CRP-like cAMP-binding protein